MEHYFDHFPGIILEINREKFRYFGGTAYLGLQVNPAFQQLFIKNVKTFGTAYGASRKSNVRMAIYDQAERLLADWTRSESCITMSSGYLAGQLLANHFDDDQYKLFYAPDCHTALMPSKIEGITPKPFTTYSALENALDQHLELNNSATPVVFLDAIDFSGNNYPEFKGIKSLPLKEIVLVVDDSHGIGIVGQEGAGVYPMLSKIEAKELIVCCSLGKALGIQAGAIFCSQQRHTELTSSDFYAGASPAAPAYLATLIQGWDLISRQRNLLNINIDLFNNGIKDIDKISGIEQYPAFSYGDPALSKYLFKNKIIVTDFAYPNDAATVSSRIVLNALHQQEDLEYILQKLQEYF